MNYTFTKTGCYSVDMAQAIINQYKNNGRPIKTLLLNKFHYDIFDKWMRASPKMDPVAKELPYGEIPYTLFDIEVELLSPLSLKEFDVNMWSMEISEEEKEKRKQKLKNF